MPSSIPAATAATASVWVSPPAVCCSGAQRVSP